MVIIKSGIISIFVELFDGIGFVTVGKLLIEMFPPVWYPHELLLYAETLPPV